MRGHPRGCTMVPKRRMPPLLLPPSQHASMHVCCCAATHVQSLRIAPSSASHRGPLLLVSAGTSSAGAGWTWPSHAEEEMCRDDTRAQAAGARLRATGRERSSIPTVCDMSEGECVTPAVPSADALRSASLRVHRPLARAALLRVTWVDPNGGVPAALPRPPGPDRHPAVSSL